MNVHRRNSSRALMRAQRDARIAHASFMFLIVGLLVFLAGCGPVQLVATARIPQPLVVKIPVAVALFLPPEFLQYVHKEERWGTDWNIDIGKAQTDAISGLMSSMFERVVAVDSLNAGSQLGESVAAILEPSVEEYAFVTPRDAGSPFYAVSIKYRVNVYLPDGKLADSWGFTGYGTAPAGGLSNTEPLENATALAMRDAGAKLAVEFRDQAIVRGLLPGAASADDPAASGAGDSASEPELEADPSTGGASDPMTPAPEESTNETEASPPQDESSEPENEQEEQSDRQRELPDPEAFAFRKAPRAHAAAS